MSWVTSRYRNDCASCAITMASGLSYKNIRRLLYKDKARHPKDGAGVSSGDIRKCLERLSIKTYPVKDGISFHSFPFLCKGKKAIAIFQWKNETFCHAVYWNGFYFKDSCYENQKLTFDFYVGKIESVDLIPMETSFYLAFASLFVEVLRAAKNFSVEYVKELKKIATFPFSLVKNLVLNTKTA